MIINTFHKEEEKERILFFICDILNLSIEILK